MKSGDLVTEDPLQAHCEEGSCLNSVKGKPGLFVVVAVGISFKMTPPFF